MSRKIRSAVIAFALVNLVVSAAFALPRASRQAPARAASAHTAWEWLVGLFASVSGTGIMAKAGSQMDPNGGRSLGNSFTPPTTDAGSRMDPDGHN
jgi:hypothetical protein